MRAGGGKNQNHGGRDESDGRSAYSVSPGRDVPLGVLGRRFGKELLRPLTPLPIFLPKHDPHAEDIDQEEQSAPTLDGRGPRPIPKQQKKCGHAGQEHGERGLSVCSKAACSQTRLSR